MTDYYRSEPDPFWEKLRENKKYESFFDDIREYLLFEHGCTFSQLREMCASPYDSFEFWIEAAEKEKDIPRLVDDVFQDVQGERQQRFIMNVVLGE